MRFSANLSFLFKDVPFGDRFRRAADAGFRAVEFMWPGTDQIDVVERAIADTGLEVALFNFDAGDMAAGERGLAGVPDRRAQFRDNVPVALELADRIGCPRLTPSSGFASRASSSTLSSSWRARTLPGPPSGPGRKAPAS